MPEHIGKSSDRACRLSRRLRVRWVPEMTRRSTRNPSEHHVTFGALYVDDVMECLTLEDEIRERPGGASVEPGSV